MEYYLCSAEVVERMKPTDVSKPFKSGYRNDDDLCYVALLDIKQVGKLYNEVIVPYNTKNEDSIEFWCRECCEGTMDVSSIDVSEFKDVGLFLTIEQEIGLTKQTNRAMVIWNLAEEEGLTPVEFINKYCA